MKQAGDAGVLALLVATAIAAGTLALRYGMFDEDGPGPGLFPLAAALLVCGAGLIVAWEFRRPASAALPAASPSPGEPAEPSEEPGAPTPLRLAIYVGALLAWAVLLEPLGHLAASGLALLALLLAGAVAWPLAIGIAAAAVAASHLLFVTLLDVPLPEPAWF